MALIHDFDETVLPVLLDWRRRDGRGALVTLVRKSGSGPRPLGAQLAVAADGRLVGLISGGCVEAAIAAEARAALAEGRNRVARFGAGASYIDLRLPCGGTLDVYVDVTVAADLLEQICGATTARHAMILATDTASGRSHIEAPRAGDDAAFATADLTWACDTVFRRLYRPPPRLVLAGRGPMVPLTAHMAALNGYAVTVLTDDDRAADGVRSIVVGSVAVGPVSGIDPEAVRWVAIDSATAIVTLFHDHDTEGTLLRRALDSPAFYIGALGSRATHSARLERLDREGFDAATLARIDGPAGVAIHAANPAEIATSIMAGIIRAYRRHRPPVEPPEKQRSGRPCHSRTG